MILQSAMERGLDVPAQEIRQIEVSDLASDSVRVLQAIRGSVNPDDLGP
jgi:hypothetical protein